MQSVLIKGGAGFIGSSLANALMISGDYNITFLDNLSRVSIWLGSANFEFVQYDMLDYSVSSSEQELPL
jgi:nucleoside-diphosphate-sugar epimerase